MASQHQNSTGLLPVYCIAAPIGDYLLDFSVNSLRLLRRLRVLLVENTLTPGDDLVARLKSRGLISEDQELIELAGNDLKTTVIARIDELVAAGEAFGMVADRGLCCFLDPGLAVVRHLLLHHAAKVELIPVGASSALDAAIMISGVDCSRFAFLGHYPEVFYWPRGVLEEKIPLVAYVRGDSIRAFLNEARTRLAHEHDLVVTLFRKIRGRMGRFRKSFELHGPHELPCEEGQPDGFTAVLHAPWS